MSFLNWSLISLWNSGEKKADGGRLYNLLLFLKLLFWNTFKLSEKLYGLYKEFLFSLHLNSSVVNILAHLPFLSNICTYTYPSLHICTYVLCIFHFCYLSFLSMRVSCICDVLLLLNTSESITYSPIIHEYIKIRKLNLVQEYHNPQTPFKFQWLTQ